MLRRKRKFDDCTSEIEAHMQLERTHEIGIRVALGAQGRNRLCIVAREGLALALAGAALGLVCALIVSHSMAGLLYGVRPTDPLTFVGVTFLSSVWLCSLATFRRGGPSASTRWSPSDTNSSGRRLLKVSQPGPREVQCQQTANG
jgi:hypothetical protein